MCSPKQASYMTFRRDFLWKFVTCLQQSVSSTSGNMSLLERRRAIKLSSDIALAFARNGSVWSRALIASISKQAKYESLVRSIMGDEEFDKTRKPCSMLVPTLKRAKSLMILRKSRMARRIRKAPRKVLASSVAKLIQKKRVQMVMLKFLVPGGELMDELTLLEETADYILALRAQIDVMRSLADTFQPFI